MIADRLDNLARGLARSRSRRDLLKLLAVSAIPGLLARRGFAGAGVLAAAMPAAPLAAGSSLSTGTASVQIVCDCDGNGTQDFSVWVNYECPGDRCFGLLSLDCRAAGLEASLAGLPAEVNAELRAQIRAGDACLTCPPLATFCPGCDVAAMQQARDDYSRWLAVYQDISHNADDLLDDASGVVRQADEVGRSYFYDRLLDLIPGDAGVFGRLAIKMEEGELVETAAHLTAAEFAETANGWRGGVRDGARAEGWIALTIDTGLALAKMLTLVGEFDTYANEHQSARQSAGDALSQAIAARDRLNALEAACRQGLGNARLPIGPAAHRALIPLGDALDDAAIAIPFILQAGERMLALSRQMPSPLEEAGASFARAAELAQIAAEQPEFSDEQGVEFFEALANGYLALAASVDLQAQLRGEPRRIGLLMDGPQPYCGPGQVPEFVFGFAALADALGATMGEPTECQHTDPGSGDALQQTTTGLSFYRASTNTPTFTNGAEHWALTANGLVYWTGDSIDPPDDAQTVEAS